MSEPDQVQEGIVQVIMAFGATVMLPDGSTGLVHISEISDGYVRDVNDFLKVGQTIRVVELPSEGGNRRKRLSIKRAGEKLKPTPPDEADYLKLKEDKEKKEKKEKKEEKKTVQPVKPDFSTQPPMFDEGRKQGGTGFDDKLAKFIKESEERLIDIKHQKDARRGGGYVRRG